MSERRTNDPFEIFQISRDLLSTQQKFLPSSKIFEQFAETIRNVTQAQIAYNQALMRANAALMAALLERPLSSTFTEMKEERPSVSARRPNMNAG
jgi:hypothetical protein